MSGSGFNPLLPEPVRDAFAILKTGAEAGRLAHGYVVSCDRIELGVSFATLVLQWLFCREPNRPCGQCRSCQHVESRVHPDTVWIEPESKSRILTIDQVRDKVNQLMHQTSFEGGWKAAVLLEADRISDGAANAFLKTLEEPPPQSLMLLVTMNFNALLPTIISRCQRVHVGELQAGAPMSQVETAMLDWLRRRAPRTSPLVQSGWINGILAEVRATAEREEKNAVANDDEEVDDKVLEARIQSRVIEARLQVLRFLYKWERDLLMLAGGGDKKHLHFPGELDTLTRQSEGLTVAACLKRIERVEEAVRLLERNVPEASVWEAILPV